MAYTTEKGSPLPLGISKREEGVNFSIFSEHGTSVRLCLFSPGAATPFFEAPLLQTGFLWHLLVLGLPEGGQIEYGYRIEGPNNPQERQLYDASKVLLDPYAKEMSTPHAWGKGEYAPRGKVSCPPPFDWENTLPPRIAMENLVIYEMHVRGLTIDPSSLSTHPGTFLGII
ncbi:MAG TPA: glycogen debranching enzyme, partial [Rhabdochlamydiaceae bacterium]